MCVLSDDAKEPKHDGGQRDEPVAGANPAAAADEQGRKELSKAERDLLRRIDPGTTALTIAGVMLVLVLCSMLPWIGDATGWQVLFGQADPALKITLLPRLFAINSTIAGVLLSALALATRRWALAWVAGMACIIVSFEGVTAIWSRQTVPEGGPSLGLVLAVVCIVVLAVQWLRVVLRRP